jgi:hypothetical protein
MLDSSHVKPNPMRSQHSHASCHHFDYTPKPPGKQLEFLRLAQFSGDFVIAAPTKPCAMQDEKKAKTA